LARSIEPGRATTESANHLRIPDLRNDQAEETFEVSAAGSSGGGPCLEISETIASDARIRLQQVETAWRPRQPGWKVDPREN
jgi:hypothetical protein